MKNGYFDVYYKNYIYISNISSETIPNEPWSNQKENRKGFTSYWSWDDPKSTDLIYVKRTGK